MPQSDLTFAVPKGRLLDDALPVMERAGVVPEPGFHDKANRALCFATERPDLRLIRVRAFDVATFVAHGAAQIGIVGSDVIEEFDYSDLYAPVDLDIGHCHLAVAQAVGEEDDPISRPNASSSMARWSLPLLSGWRGGSSISSRPDARSRKTAWSKPSLSSTLPPA